MRPYWKIERTFDTRKNPDGTPRLVKETKGWWGKTHPDDESSRLTPQQLQDHWKNAADQPITDDQKFWHLVKTLVKLNTENWTGEGYDTSNVHRGNIWKEAERVGWSADEAWEMMSSKRTEILSAARSIVAEECEGLEKDLWPQIHYPTFEIPETEITNKTQASERTHIANGLRSHIAKRGKRLPKKKN